MDLLRRVALSLATPVLALVAAALVTTALLALVGEDVGGFWSVMSTPPNARQQVNIINAGSALYLSGVAAAIGFRMNLFNIGVEGQYGLAAFMAAWFAGGGLVSGPLNTVLAVLIAMVTGALWAGIAGVLKVTRGVSEVIGTIMLNAISGLLVSYLLAKYGTNIGVSQTTTPMPESSRIPEVGIIPGASSGIDGLAFLAVVVGVAYWVVLTYTRFGFSLRAAGASETAAAAAGIDVRRMALVAMLASGAIAGLIAMPSLFSDTFAYGTGFQPGLGFTGIAVALLGRNHPGGIVFGAAIFAYLVDRGTQLNVLAGISPEIVSVTQGIIVLSVVVAYAIVQRYRTRSEQASVARRSSATSAKEVLA
ncbi:ABC transporter permease [Nocardioides acrostichi]|uniref:ABC transporter permease n=1 Tax=Nocardioides acrostichi TaxID=2784339 RepID=A0A930UX80_9ACTN|nr:ABC transporter permease [Nocardioides acrostichi]MBF4161786.1 ABC transporter permease [Nocardioides acrostichi]